MKRYKYFFKSDILYRKNVFCFQYCFFNDWLNMENINRVFVLLFGNNCWSKTNCFSTLINGFNSCQSWYSPYGGERPVVRRELSTRGRGGLEYSRGPNNLKELTAAPLARPPALLSGQRLPAGHCQTQQPRLYQDTTWQLTPFGVFVFVYSSIRVSPHCK